MIRVPLSVPSLLPLASPLMSTPSLLALLLPAVWAGVGVLGHNLPAMFFLPMPPEIIFTEGTFAIWAKNMLNLLNLLWGIVCVRNKDFVDELGHGRYYIKVDSPRLTLHLGLRKTLPWYAQNSTLVYSFSEEQNGLQRGVNRNRLRRKKTQGKKI